MKVLQAAAFVACGWLAFCFCILMPLRLRADCQWFKTWVAMADGSDGGFDPNTLTEFVAIWLPRVFLLSFGLPQKSLFAKCFYLFFFRVFESQYSGGPPPERQKQGGHPAVYPLLCAAKCKRWSQREGLGRQREGPR